MYGLSTANHCHSIRAVESEFQYYYEASIPKTKKRWSALRRRTVSQTSASLTSLARPRPIRKLLVIRLCCCCCCCFSSRPRSSSLVLAGNKA